MIFTVLMINAVVTFASGTGHTNATPHAATIGVMGKPSEISRTIKIDMDDNMRFSPARIKVKRGETIAFVIKNKGKIKHEMVLGSVAELKKHAKLMQKFPEMEHDDPNQVAADPGQTVQMIWHFTQTGKFNFACLQPGHFESGMTGQIIVE